MAAPNTPVALVTGCSSPDGIGAALALELLAKGWRVFASARRMESMQGLKNKGCETLVLDVTDEDAIKAAVTLVAEQTGGKLNLLVNSAGSMFLGPLLDIPVSTVRSVFEVNAVGLLAVTQAFSTLLVNAAVLKEKSLVLNIGSIASTGTPWAGLYSASKAATHCLSDVLMIELEPLGVKVVTLHPGRVATAMSGAVETFDPPAGSYYASAWPRVQKARQDFLDKDAAKAPSPAAFARQVVGHILQDAPKGELWAGYGSWLMKNLIPLLPFSVMTAIRRKMAFTNMIDAPTETRDVGATPSSG